MAVKISLLLLLFSFFSVLASLSSGQNSTEFIRERCGVTRYPNLCFTSLASYSSAVQENPVQLARVATNLTLARVTALSARVATLRRTCPASAIKEAAALRDCADSLGDAVDQTQRTAEELRGLDTAVGPEVAWRVSNAQTWMSAALTNEDTCSDGFDIVAATSRTKSDVCRRVRRVKEFTSNALALVNSLVTSR